MENRIGPCPKVLPILLPSFVKTTVGGRKEKKERLKGKNGSSRSVIHAGFVSVWDEKEGTEQKESS